MRSEGSIIVYRYIIPCVSVWGSLPSSLLSESTLRIKGLSSFENLEWNSQFDNLSLPGDLLVFQTHDGISLAC